MLETGRQDKELEGLSLLGNQGTKYKFGYDPNILEVFDNKHPNNDYFVKFNCPEFTSLCPITGQPDFATIYISYIPGEKMVESKSLKLYLYMCVNSANSLFIKTNLVGLFLYRILNIFLMSLTMIKLSTI